MVDISTWRSRIGSFLQKAKNCLTIKGINKLGISYSYFISLVVSVHFLIDSNETKKFTEGINKLGSWSIYFFGCCLVNYCGGLIRWILWHSGSTRKGHHAMLWQGVSNWQFWAASLIQHLLMIEFRVHFSLLYSCLQFAVTAD